MTIVVAEGTVEVIATCAGDEARSSQVLDEDSSDWEIMFLENRTSFREVLCFKPI